MAGSYKHVTKDGTFNSDAFYNGIENLGDAYECVEELCGMIEDLRAELAASEARVAALVGALDDLVEQCEQASGLSDANYYEFDLNEAYEALAAVKEEE